VIAGTIAMAFRDSAARKSLGMAEAEHFGSDHSVELSAIDHGQSPSISLALSVADEDYLWG